MLERNRVEEILRQTGVLIEGHFILTSGRHSDKYMQCAKLFIDPEISERISAELAEKFKGEKIDYVVGPALGGVILSYEMARQLGAKNIFAERKDGNMMIRRGFKLPAGARVLVVEDVVTTGGSVFEVIELVRAAEAELAGVAVVVDRSGGRVNFGEEIQALITMDIEVFQAQNCPMCAQKLPIDKPGSRQPATEQDAESV